jgi:hypothetical protein
MREVVTMMTQTHDHETPMLDGVALLDSDRFGDLVLFDERRRIPVGSVRTEKAEDVIGERIGLSARDLAYAVVARPPTLHVEDLEVRKLLLYLAARSGRMIGRKLLIATLEPNAPELAMGPFSPVARMPGTFVADIQHTAHRAFVSMNEATKCWVGRHLLAQELEATVRRRTKEIHGNLYFRKVFDGTITKAQYVESLANNHQFVRWTTRLLGGIIGATGDRALRKSFIHHLEGEVDHELLIENDLRHLGADVEYVRDAMVPSVEIQQFMCVQESMCGFHRDPLAFLAVPFTIEGVTAFLGPDFVEALERSIRSWGHDRPRLACTFITSHIQFDGGDDGHWEGSRQMFQQLLRTELALQRALNIVHMVANAFDAAYVSYVSAPDLTVDRS